MRNDEYIHVIPDSRFSWINNKSWIVFLNPKTHLLIKKFFRSFKFEMTENIIIPMVFYDILDQTTVFGKMYMLATHVLSLTTCTCNKYDS